MASKFSDLDFELAKVLAGYLVLNAANGEAPFEGLERAPQQFWDLYERSATEVRVGEPKVPVTAPTPTPIPRPYFRVAESMPA